MKELPDLSNAQIIQKPKIVQTQPKHRFKGNLTAHLKTLLSRVKGGFIEKRLPPFLTSPNYTPCKKISLNNPYTDIDV